MSSVPDSVTFTMYFLVLFSCTCEQISFHCSLILSPSFSSKQHLGALASLPRVPLSPGTAGTPAHTASRDSHTGDRDGEHPRAGEVPHPPCAFAQATHC